MVPKPPDEIVRLFLRGRKVVGLDDALALVRIEDNRIGAWSKGKSSLADRVAEDGTFSRGCQQGWEGDELSVLRKTEDSTLRTTEVGDAAVIAPLLHGRRANGTGVTGRCHGPRLSVAEGPCSLLGCPHQQAERCEIPRGAPCAHATKLLQTPLRDPEESAEKSASYGVAS